jgi:hypothetical protein
MTGTFGTVNSPSFMLVVTSQMKTFDVVYAVAQNKILASFEKQKQESSGDTDLNRLPSGLRKSYLILELRPSSISASLSSSFSVKKMSSELAM